MKILLSVMTNKSYPKWKVLEHEMNSKVIKTLEDIEKHNCYEFQKEYAKELNFEPDERMVSEEIGLTDKDFERYMDMLQRHKA